ncbi:hypothetical protein V8D89_007066 [Ganoderma adspersum]
MNITVDDQLGDPITGLVPQYFPDDKWLAGSPTENCTACHLNPGTLDLNQIHGKTWHDSTPLNSPIPTTITFQFTGSAVYVFNIVPNTLPNSTITLANITFSIDDTDPYTFYRQPDPNSNTILYNQLVYHNIGLEDGPHTLTMTVGHYSLILFDYLLYTRGSANTTSTSATSTSGPTNAVTQTSPSDSMPTQSASSGTPVGAIVGAVVGGVILLFGVAFGAFQSEPARRREGYGAFPTRKGPTDPDATSLPAVDSDPVMRWRYGAETHNLLDPMPDISGQVAPQPSLAVTTNGALTSERPSKRRALELTRRLQALQRTRSVLSSQPPSGHSPPPFSSEGGVETAMRELEAEMAELRGVLATLNVRVADRSQDGQLEPLPEYME